MIANGKSHPRGAPGPASIELGHALRGLVEPYPDADALVRDQLLAIRARARVASGQLAAAARDERLEPPWPPELLAFEAHVDARARATHPALPVTRLRDRFALTATEDRVLWALIAHALCPIARQLVRELDTEDAPDPSTDALRRLAHAGATDAIAWHELGEAGALRRAGLIQRADGGGDASDYRQTWRAHRRVLALAHGDAGLDPALAPLAALEPAEPAVPLAALELADGVAARAGRAIARGGLVLVHGPAGHGRRSLLTPLAAARGLRVLRVRGAAIAAERAAARRQLRAIARECRLLDLVPLICDLDALGPAPGAPDRIDLIEALADDLAEAARPGLVLATAARPLARRWARPPLAIPLPPLAAPQHRRLWARALPAAPPGDAELLGTLYPLAPALIAAAGRRALAESGGEPLLPADVEAGVRAVLDDRFAGLAARVPVAQGWDDLVLADDATAELGELLARVRARHRVHDEWGFPDRAGARGVAALLSGPPGTGKTMAAGLVAAALQRELYRADARALAQRRLVDLERDLAALFEAAEAGHAVLLLDDADALLARRPDARAGLDRYAAQAAALLAQRLERSSGVCLLTAVHEAALDGSLRRRLAMHVRFPIPDAADRARLWRAMIPAGAPVAGPLPLDDLAARFAMSGGHIRNAVLRAAFLAADERVPIDAARLARAAELEYAAAGARPPP